MQSTTLTTLEFTRIQQELAVHASCQLGKELALQIEPLPSPTLIRQAQQETTEARAILEGGRTMPFGSISDVRLFADRAAAGGVLRPDQLLAVADTIYGCRQLHRFLTEHRAAAPLLSRHAEAFGRFDDAEAEIRRCIEHGAVSSRASRGLRQVRAEISILESRIQERLTGLLKQYRSHLQEALVTTRGGRYVIPVKASARAAVPGAVQGASASGSTLFVEPAAIAQLCGELQTWRAMEEAEVEQVLVALSGHVAGHAENLKATLEAVAALDLIAARARLSLAWEARPVEWNEAGVVDLKGARHPLLGRSAVGNRIRMAPDSRMLIVTGPNTGGKTLLLKTLGLLVTMARCGLQIPVEAGSTLCHFTGVFADVGDHQSLEQSLSTFSGHIASVAPMLRQAGPQTLILLDELGSGTDPHEGTGLGIALLEAFLQKGAYCLATTHLREIKEFGRATAGCAYAGMGFDGETLRPTYHLLYQTLGESHGLEIAARAGLPAEVVERARELVYGERRGASVVEFAAAPAVTEAEAEPVPVVAEAVPAPVVVEALSPSRCRVWVDGAGRELTVRQALRRERLVPGDRVFLHDGQVAGLAPRRTVLISRDADTMAETVVAANATQLLIVLSCRQPDFHASVLARHMLYAERQGLEPLICLTKADLVPAGAPESWLGPLQAVGYRAVVVSATRGRGLGELHRLLAGRLTAVIGVPGAGKTTLLARLTAAPLLDLPGLRELGVWKPDLADGFREFGPFAVQCSRPGCLHRQEPGCAVREATDQGRLVHQRYAQYLHLLRQMGLV